MPENSKTIHCEMLFSHKYTDCRINQVLIFAEKKRDVDSIHEYLLLKGVEAVATHGDKDQEDRSWAVDQFKVHDNLMYKKYSSALIFRLFR